MTDDCEAASTGSLDFEDRFDEADEVSVADPTDAEARDSIFTSSAEEGTAALRDPIPAWVAAGYVEHLAAVLHPRGQG